MFQECLKFVKNVHFSQSEDFTSKHLHPSDPLSDIHLDATALLLKVSYDPLFWLVYCFISIGFNYFDMYCRF